MVLSQSLQLPKVIKSEWIAAVSAKGGSWWPSGLVGHQQDRQDLSCPMHAGAVDKTFL